MEKRKKKPPARLAEAAGILEYTKDVNTFPTLGTTSPPSLPSPFFPYPQKKRGFTCCIPYSRKLDDLFHRRERRCRNLFHPRQNFHFRLDNHITLSYFTLLWWLLCKLFKIFLRQFLSHFFTASSQPNRTKRWWKTLCLSMRF